MLIVTVSNILKIMYINIYLGVNINGSKGCPDISMCMCLLYGVCKYTCNTV